MLDATQKDRLLQLFAEGAELPAAERPAFVARACADDPELRRELGELLEVEAMALASTVPNSRSIGSGPRPSAWRRNVPGSATVSPRAPRQSSASSRSRTATSTRRSRATNAAPTSACTAADVRALPACDQLRGEPFVDDLLGR